MHSAANDTGDVHIKLYSPIKESPNNNKENSKVSAQYTPTLLIVKVVEKTEIKEPRNTSRVSKVPQPYIEVPRLKTIPWYSNLTGYIKPSRTFKPTHTFTV